jgi:hypothetical protein
MDAIELIKQFGDELQKLVRATDNTNRFTASKELVDRMFHSLEELPPAERARFQVLLIDSHQSGMIGDFRIPFDLRDEYDWIEGILATIEGFLDS